MTKKILISVILIIAMSTSIIIPKIYADNFIVSIPSTTIKQGEQLKVYINVENIKDYVASKVVLTTDVYLEPILDIADTGMANNDVEFDNANRTFTIDNIPNDVKTICVLYTIPTYIANSTKIKLTYSIIDEKEEEQEENTFEITVISDATNNLNQDKPDNDMQNNQGNADNIENENNANTRK